MTGGASALGQDGAVDDGGAGDGLVEVLLVAGEAECRGLLAELVFVVGGVGVVAASAALLEGGVHVHALLALCENFIVAGEAEGLLVGGQEAWLLGGMWFVADDAGAGGDRAVDELCRPEVLGVALCAEFASGVGDEGLWEVRAVRVVAVQAAALLCGGVHGVFVREAVAAGAEFLFGDDVVELVLFGVSLDMAGIALGE